MKPINCPFEQEKHKSYLRCVNRDTLKYVDIPISHPMQLNILIYFIENADEISGNWSVVCGKKKVEYHYGIHFCMHCCELDKNEKESWAVPAFIVKEGAAYRLDINKDTNEILSIEEKICDI